MIKDRSIALMLAGLAATTLIASAAQQAPQGNGTSPASQAVNPAIWPAPASPFRPDPAMERFISDLIGRMTVEEKVAQVIQPDIGSVTPEDMRRGYEDWTERARQFLHDKGLVSFPAGEECAVVPSPPFQRPVLAVASSPVDVLPTNGGRVVVMPDGSTIDGARLRSSTTR